MEEANKDGRRDDIYSKIVRAGRRTYFFDVKATRSNDYYLTVTESKKSTQEDGSATYEKHKIFLYKEDFEKFAEGLSEVIGYIKEHQPESAQEQKEDADVYKSDVSFDDLAK